MVNQCIEHLQVLALRLVHDGVADGLPAVCTWCACHVDELVRTHDGAVICHRCQCKPMLAMRHALPTPPKPPGSRICESRRFPETIHP